MPLRAAKFICLGVEYFASIVLLPDGWAALFEEPGYTLIVERGLSPERARELAILEGRFATLSGPLPLTTQGAVS